MKVVYMRWSICCCGLDVRAKTVMTCLVTKGRKEIRTFATMTDELLQLGDWLSSAGCTHVAIESTGVYWQPVFNILERLLTRMKTTIYQLDCTDGAPERLFRGRSSRLRFGVMSGSPTQLWGRCS